MVPTNLVDKAELALVKIANPLFTEANTIKISHYYKKILTQNLI